MEKIINQQHNIVFIGVKKLLDNGQVVFNIRGTGFIVKRDNKKFIVTCSHVYQQITSSEQSSIFCGAISPVTINDESEKKYDFYDISFVMQHPDQRRDVCLFEFKKNENNLKDYGYEIDNLQNEDGIKELKMLDTVEFQGFPLGNELLQLGMGITLAVSQTIISSIKYSSIDHKIDFILIDKLVNPGSSGSPVFHNEKIIGIASGTINQTHRIGETLINVPVNIGLVRTSNYILELLNSLDLKS